MSNPVVVEDLEARFRPLTDAAERATAEALLADAWAIALTQAPTLEQRLSSGALDPAVAVAVISAVVLRVLRNPDGIRTWSVDDYSQTRDATVAGGALYLSEDELRLLAPSGSTGSAFSITTSNVGPGQRLLW